MKIWQATIFYDGGQETVSFNKFIELGDVIEAITENYKITAVHITPTGKPD